MSSDFSTTIFNIVNKLTEPRGIMSVQSTANLIFKWILIAFEWLYIGTNPSSPPRQFAIKLNLKLRRPRPHIKRRTATISAALLLTFLAVWTEFKIWIFWLDAEMETEINNGSAMSLGIENEKRSFFLITFQSFLPVPVKLPVFIMMRNHKRVNVSWNFFI